MKRFTSLSELFLISTARYTHDRALSYIHADGTDSYSTAEFRQRVLSIAHGLLARGIEPGDRIGLLGPSTPDWVIADLGIQCAGAVTTPIFNKISDDSLIHEFKDSGMKLLFLGNAEERDHIKKCAPKTLPVISYGAASNDKSMSDLLEAGEKAKRAYEDKLTANSGRPVSPDDMRLIPGPRNAEDLATIIYTSGSTGLPKGVELLNSNICSQIQGIHERVTISPENDVALSVLPLAHVFERVLDYYYISSGVPITYVDDAKKIGEYIRIVRPTFMVSVPRILEKVYMRITEHALEIPGIAGVIARSAVRRALRVDPDKEKPANKGFAGSILDRLVYEKFRAALGGKLNTIISGSARLSPDVARFFTNIGIEIYEGYGLTEASPIISVNWPGNRRIGTVGPIFHEVEAKIGDKGEVLARGPGIMHGYHNLPAETARSIDSDGWLHTGDIGTMEDGFLTITGRLKELFKKSTGEYVPPVPLESELNLFPIVDTSLVVADNRTYVSALLFPDPVKLKAFKEKSGFAEMDDESFIQGEFLRKKLREYIDGINAHHHHCERIEAFTIVNYQPSVEAGDITPSLKLRRFVVEEKFRQEIESMYKNNVGAAR